MATEGSGAGGSIAGLVVDATLVRALLHEQFPAWASLPLRPVARSGKDHRMLRLGSDKLVRLPSAPEFVPQVEKEQAWLPRLAAAVPLPIPVVFGRGRPSKRFPAPWSVYGWIDGEPAASATVDRERLASDLAAFLVALRAADTTGAPPPGPHSAGRGAPLAHLDAELQDLLERVHGRERDAAAGIWREAMAAAPAPTPVWFHGDVSVTNLLVRGGRLSAVIDFGCAGVGDPACDTAITWTHLDGAASRTFRRGLALDDATWARGRGWAIWKALLMLDAPRAEHAALGRRVLDRLLSEA